MMTQRPPTVLLTEIELLLRDEGWRDIRLAACEDGFEVAAHHEGDPRRERITFGLGPADLDAIVRLVGKRQTTELCR
jgi:hypothetical protein